MVVDDNADAADVLGEFLRSKGHEVCVAHDAPAALAAAATLQPEVEILDIGLPVMDGYELAERLRALANVPALRLFALTGYGRAHDKSRSDAAGFERHLVKPVDPEGLLSALSAQG